MIQGWHCQEKLDPGHSRGKRVKHRPWKEKFCLNSVRMLFNPCFRKSTALNCILLVLKFMKQSVSIILYLLIRVTHSKQYFVWHILLLKPLSLQYQYAYSPYCSFCISSGVDQGNLFKNQDHLFCSCDPKCFTQGWYCKEKLDASKSQGIHVSLKPI